jgi:ribosomal protein S18 acetylase RimI-like enzyme
MIRLHEVAFPGFFLTSLGARFLRLLYSSFVNVDSGICIVAENESGVIGLVAGTSNPESFFKTLLRRMGVSFAIAAIPGLLRAPVPVVRKCMGAIFYRGEKPKEMTDAGLLSSLAVSPQVSGNNIGRQLVNTFCDELLARGVEAVYLTTDASGNDGVNRFYEKCGFHLVDRFERPNNRCMNRWAKVLKRPDLQAPIVNTP